MAVLTFCDLVQWSAPGSADTLELGWLFLLLDQERVCDTPAGVTVTNHAGPMSPTSNDQVLGDWESVIEFVGHDFA